MRINLMFNASRWSPLSLYLSARGTQHPNTPIKEYIEFAIHLEKHHGTSNAVKTLKELNSSAKLAALGYPSSSRKLNRRWYSVNDLGLPKKLKSLSALIRKDPVSGLAITNLVYLMRLPPDTDVRTITDPYTGTWDLPQTLSFQEFLKSECPRLVPSECNLVPSVKSGPNGPPAIVMASRDAVAWSKKKFQLLRFLWYTIKTGQTIGQRLVDFLTSGWDYIPSVPRGDTHLSKLAFLSDKAGKTRVIYLLNWWAQQALLPIHDAMMLWFKTQRQDATWDQDKAVEQVRKWTEEGKTLFSYDLTAATDRWPAFHQKLVINTAFGPDWAHLWQMLLSEMPPWVPEFDHSVRYEVGQGMGGYSSWPALNLTHHLTIRWLAKIHSRPSDYVVLGDDVVIADKIVAKAYAQVLNSLGVTISQGKSVICEDGKPSSAEFAKHLLREGKNLTPISPSILKEVYEDFQWWKFPTLLRESKFLKDKPILKANGIVYLPKSVIKLLAPISRDFREKIIILISAPIEPFYYEGVSSSDQQPSDAFYESVKDPWNGMDSMLVGAARLTALLDELFGAAEKLLALRDSLKGGTGKCFPGVLLENSKHPLHECLKALETEITSICRLLSDGESRPGDWQRANHLLVDVDLLNAILIEGKSFSEWKSQKDLRTMKGVSHRLKVHGYSLNPDTMYSEEGVYDY